MKPFIFVTTENFNGLPFKSRALMAEHINKLLNGKCKLRGYTHLFTDGGRAPISEVKHLNDTIEVFSFTRPIEEEKPECDHWANIDLGKHKFDFDFCPLCGEELK